MSTRLQRQYESSPFHGANAPYIEALYESYLEDPANVSDEWRRLFIGLNGDKAAEVAHAPVVAALTKRLRSAGVSTRNGGAVAAPASQASEKQAAV